ncbi:F-box/LRR-repeat protein 12-like [Saccoglossus kowalevskii]|uniref:F-box/LRR-repeat protein 12-like n=1 Tax=Saccoglossus kowalevskii TaxID=10224 RepID=A0ABM0N024_SACKO|nr:PREDICTED: F-box/LRR-repeat protein 12-like [Saccoglossus kowalevskii]
MARRGACRAVAEANSQLLTNQSLANSEFGKLPDNIMLDIFSFMDTHDKCRVARVCKSWNRLINDKSLWQHVDLQNCRVNLRNVWKVVRNHLSTSLKSLKLRGFLNSVKNTECLSNAVLMDLKERCPNLKYLEVVEANFGALEVTSLPKSLATLVLRSCQLPMRWFKGMKEHNALPELEYLDLTRCTRIAQFDLRDIAIRKHIKVLKLSNCYRINDTGVQHITEEFPDLEVLELNACDITDLSLHHISRHLKKLKMLNLSQCVSLSDSGVVSLSTLKSLHWLSVYQCHKLSEDGIVQVARSMKSLTYFNVSGVKNVTNETKELIKVALAGCEVCVDGDECPYIRCIY